MELGDEMAGSKRPAEEPELEGAPDLKRLALNLTLSHSRSPMGTHSGGPGDS